MTGPATGPATPPAASSAGEATTPRPKFRTGVIWGLLALFLTLGTAAAGFFVWGLAGLLSTHAYLLDGVVMVLGAFTAVYLMLLIVGILYRIDRLRGVPHRRVELFE